MFKGLNGTNIGRIPSPYLPQCQLNAPAQPQNANKTLIVADLKVVQFHAFQKGFI